MRVEHRAGVAWLVLDRPERLNAFTGDDYRDIRDGIVAAGADPAIGSIVLTGEGRAFSAGADRSLVDGTASDEVRAQAGEAFSALLAAMGRCEKPLFAAVDGLAVGFGATILLHCDLVVLAESARLRMPFTALGLVPEAGSSVLLPARARWSDSLWAMLSSEWIEAEDALRMGIAWRVVPDQRLADEVQQAAATLAALDPVAVAATRRLMHAGRADVVGAAMDREMAAMRSLSLRRAGPAPGS